MTVKATLATIRAMGLAVSIRDGEYRITFRREDLRRMYPDRASFEAAEANAYYTCDAHDAICTARLMTIEIAGNTSTAVHFAWLRAEIAETRLGGG